MNSSSTLHQAIGTPLPTPLPTPPTPTDEGGMKEWPVHPFTDLVPSMSDSDYARLKEDIRLYGQQEQIVVCGNQLIDGRHRQKACRELGIEVQHCRVDLSDKEVIRFVLRMSAIRRQMTWGQKALMGARLVHGIVALDSSGGQFKMTCREASEFMGVSITGIYQAGLVVKKGIVPLQKLLEADKVAVSTAALVAKRGNAEQQAFVATPRQRRKKSKEPSASSVDFSIRGRFKKILADLSAKADSSSQDVKGLICKALQDLEELRQACRQGDVTGAMAGDAMERSAA